MTAKNENTWRLPSEAPLDGTRVRVWVDECDGFEHPTDCVAVKGYKPNKADWLEGRWADIGLAQGEARRGETAIIDNSTVQIEQENNGMFLFSSGASLDDLVRAVNDVGAAPGDLVAILEALKQVGALRAELIVI